MSVLLTLTTSPPPAQFSLPRSAPRSLLLFFFTATATTEIYTLSLHDALPIFALRARQALRGTPRRSLRFSLWAGDVRSPVLQCIWTAAGSCVSLLRCDLYFCRPAPEQIGRAHV